MARHHHLLPYLLPVCTSHLEHPLEVTPPCRDPVGLVHLDLEQLVSAAGILFAAISTRVLHCTLLPGNKCGQLCERLSPRSTEANQKGMSALLLDDPAGDKYVLLVKKLLPKAPHLLILDVCSKAYLNMTSGMGALDAALYSLR